MCRTTVLGGGDIRVIVVFLYHTHVTSKVQTSVILLGREQIRSDEYAKERREQKNLRTHLLRICVFGATKSQPKTLETKKSLNAS